MFMHELIQIEARERGRETTERRKGRGLPPHIPENNGTRWAADICPLCGQEVPVLRKHRKMEHADWDEDFADTMEPEAGG